MQTFDWYCIGTVGLRINTFLPFSGQLGHFREQESSFDIRSPQSVLRTLCPTIELQGASLLPKCCLEFIRPVGVRTVVDMCKLRAADALSTS